MSRTARLWFSFGRAGLMVFLYYAVFPDWPIWRICIAAFLTSTILTITTFLGDSDV